MCRETAVQITILKASDMSKAILSLLRKGPGVSFKISDRERRFVTMGAVACFLILGYTFGLNPFLERQKEVKKEIALKQKVLIKSQGYARRTLPLQQDVTRLRSRLQDMEAGLLDSNNPFLAAANLQEIIKGVAGRAGVSVTSVRVLPGVPVDVYTEIPVRIETTEKITGLRDLLYEVESCPKLLKIKEMNVYVRNWGPRVRPVRALPAQPRGFGARQAPGSDPGLTTEFRTSLVISGYIKPAVADNKSHAKTLPGETNAAPDEPAE